MIGAVSGARRAGTVPWTFYRTSLPDLAPIDPDSDAIAARFAWEIARLTASSADNPPLTGPLGGPRTITYKVGSGFPRQSVATDHDGIGNDAAGYQARQLEGRLGVPIPPGAVIKSNTNDKALAILQWSKSGYWEFLWMNNQVKDVAIYNVLGSGGGSPGLALGTYRYKVTATTAAGETKGPTTPDSVTLTGSQNRVRVHWVSRYGAEITSIKIYRTALNGAAGTEKLLTTLTRATNPECFDAINDWYSEWYDEGQFSLGAASPPGSNTAMLDADNWRCWSGVGTLRQASSSSGYFRDIDSGPGSPQGRGWGTQATNTTFIGGEITRRDYERGVIDHSMTMALRNFPATTVAGVTGATPSTFTKTAHGLTNDEPIGLVSLVGGAGLSVATGYYVIRLSANTFQLSLTKAGGAVTFSTPVTSVSIRRNSNLNPIPNGSWIDGTRHAFPAQSRDGQDMGGVAGAAMLAAGCPVGALPIPEGAMLRLPPKAPTPWRPGGGPDIDAMDFSALPHFSQRRWAYMVNKCLQDYGMFTIDGTGDFNAFFCRAAQVDGTGWRPGQPELGLVGTTTFSSAPGNPFHLNLEYAVWMTVPWDQLEVVRMGWSPELPVDAVTTPCASTSIPCLLGGQ